MSTIDSEPNLASSQAVLVEEMQVEESRPTDCVGQSKAMARGCLSQVWTFKGTLLMVLAPIVMLPVPIMYPTPAGKCAYAVLIMAVYWCTEVIPMAATALLPIVLMPWLGVRSSADVCVNYLKDTNMLFLGGLLVAVAVERWNLHKRIALRVLMMVGSKPRWLMFGFMMTTAFLSMWISNTATTAMMVPIAHAVLAQLRKHHLGDPSEEDKQLSEDPEKPQKPKKDFTVYEGPLGKTYEKQISAGELTPPPKSNTAKIFPTEDAEANNQEVIIKPAPIDKEEAARIFDNMEIGLSLSVCYAANIGGTATLTGTGPNLVLKGQVDLIYGPSTGINFSSWFIFAFPNMLISLFLAWFWLQLLYLGPKELLACIFKRNEKPDESAAAVIRDAYKKLGPMTFAEIGVLCHFIVLALLWLTREPEFVPGWAKLYFLEPGYVTDASVAITVSVCLFMFPSRRPNFLCFRKKGDRSLPSPAPSLLDWHVVQERMAWSVVVVLGGGFALADSCKHSGLSQIIGEAFRDFASFPIWALVFVLCLITAGITEVTSNVATATIFLPILAELAGQTGIHPLYLMIPVTVSASFAFMLPVATPPNAIVFAFGNMKIFDMVKTGIMMNILCIVVLQVAINSWGFVYFGLGTFPSWADNMSSNLTTATSGVFNTTG